MSIGQAGTAEPMNALSVITTLKGNTEDGTVLALRLPAGDTAQVSEAGAAVK